MNIFVASIIALIGGVVLLFALFFFGSIIASLVLGTGVGMLG